MVNTPCFLVFSKKERGEKVNRQVMTQVNYGKPKESEASYPLNSLSPSYVYFYRKLGLFIIHLLVIFMPYQKPLSNSLSTVASLQCPRARATGTRGESKPLRTQGPQKANVFRIWAELYCCSSAFSSKWDISVSMTT